jgi:hypothetical protein
LGLARRPSAAGRGEHEHVGTVFQSGSFAQIVVLPIDVAYSHRRNYLLDILRPIGLFRFAGVHREDA